MINATSGRLKASCQYFSLYEQLKFHAQFSYVEHENSFITSEPGVSGNRCESDCRSRGREFDPGPVPYFRGD